MYIFVPKVKSESMIMGACLQDSLQLRNLFTNETGFQIDQRFNNFVFQIESDASYLSLTFATCFPTSRALSEGSGFKAVVQFSGKVFNFDCFV